MRTKIKPADTWFSKCVRERSSWKCECCGKQYEEGSMGLHCSHHISRRYRNTRWCGDNASAHCYGCHQKLGSHPHDFHDWIVAKLGESLTEINREKAQSAVKVSKVEEKEIAKHYKQEYEKLKQRRMDGEVGYIEFESWQ